MRLALGCMRLADGELVRLAAARGVRVFDTARAYGDSERIVGEAVRGIADARVVTKCGMRRDGSAWVPDGRASAIAADVEASRGALGVPIDTLLLHAPDPRTPLATSVRALARARDGGLTRRIGLANVTRRQLEQAAEVASIDTVQVALGARDDASARGGVLAWCRAHGIEVLTYRALGGPQRASKLSADAALRRLAEGLAVTPAELVLAYLAHVDPTLLTIVGATRPATLDSCLRAHGLTLDAVTLRALDARFPSLGHVRAPSPPPRADTNREVVLFVGLPGAGKSRAAEAFTADGFLRLNRDELGGTLRGIAKRLDAALRDGADRVVVDNTYVTRASRSDVVRVAHAHGARVRCVYVATSIDDARVNLANRMLQRHGALLGGPALLARSKKDPGLFAPLALHRMLRDLEPPSEDEGFASIDVLPFERVELGRRRAAAIALEAVEQVDRGDVAELDAVLVFGHIVREREHEARRAAAALEQRLGREVSIELCAHVSGPPACWCRPPLPGLFVAFAMREGIDARASVLVGKTAEHAAMARTLGLRYVAAS